MGAKSVIIYGDGIPPGSTISWKIDDAALLSKAVDDPDGIDETAQQLGVACVPLPKLHSLNSFLHQAPAIDDCAGSSPAIGCPRGLLTVCRSLRFLSASDRERSCAGPRSPVMLGLSCTAALLS